MLNLIKALVSARGISGYEKAISDKILKLIVPYVDKAWKDPMGNVIAFW